MKKIYISPAVRVAEMETEAMIAASGPNVNTVTTDPKTPTVSDGSEAWSVGSDNDIWDDEW
ncbi:MAG: hypothetical protein NC388_07735 [Clostridium sp.]|nr:hypothetical protein [Clostridium sp.]